MDSNEAKRIFLQALPELSEPIKSAVEFTLANWYRLSYEPRTSESAINFFASLLELPSNDIDKNFSVEINGQVKFLRDDLDVWLSLENLPHEIWRDAVDYEGLYKVSNFGRVKSFRHKYPKILRANEQSKGYMQVRLHRNGKTKNFGVHILVAQAFIDNPENKREVDHRNGDKTNNCVWNLDWVTRKENAARAYKLGLIKVYRGTQSHYAKLNAKEIVYIRENSDGLNSRELAKKFNVSRATINRIKAGVTYKDTFL